MKFIVIVIFMQEDFNQWVVQVKKLLNILNIIDDFNKLVELSENNLVEYFFSVKLELFKGIIGKFMGDMNMYQKGDDIYLGMDMSQGMDMGEYVVYVGVEE